MAQTIASLSTSNNIEMLDAQGGTVTPWPASDVSGTLPVLYINVYTDETHTEYNNEIIDKDLSHKNYFDYAEYWLDINGCQWLIDAGVESVGSKQKPKELKIKARGNYTRHAFSKKPFKIKLDKKQNLLNLTPTGSKHYALLAHADDAMGFLRNFTGFSLAKRIGLPWTPWQQPVELVINNDYRGIYFLTESIRVEPGRLEISELDDNETNENLITGGYLVELDNTDEENQIVMVEKSCEEGRVKEPLRITWDTPEEYSPIQKRFITYQFTRMNDAIGANSDLTWSYIDLDDAARYYLVYEIISHGEGFRGSTYMFRDRGENQKWHFSPLWDCGHAFEGSTNDYFFNYYRTIGFTYVSNTWIPSLIYNKKFLDKVSETWLWFMSNEFDGIYDEMEEYIGRIEQAAIKDAERWANQAVPKATVANNSNIRARFDYVKKRMEAKIEWMKGLYGDFTGATYEEPARDMTPAAPLEYDMFSGTEVSLKDNSGIVLKYYNLQGLEVKKPDVGHIYIMTDSNGTYRKIMYQGGGNGHNN